MVNSVGQSLAKNSIPLPLAGYLAGWLASWLAVSWAIISIPINNKMNNAIYLSLN